MNYAGFTRICCSVSPQIVHSLQNHNDYVFTMWYLMKEALHGGYQVSTYMIYSNRHCIRNLWQKREELGQQSSAHTLHVR